MKKIILTETKADTEFGQGSVLAIAFNTGCFGKLAENDPNVAIVKQDPIKKQPAVRTLNPDKASPYKFIFWFGDKTVQLRETDTDNPKQKMYDTTWSCEKVNKAVNPSVAELPQRVVDALKEMLQIKFHDELKGQDFFNYQQVDLQKVVNNDPTEIAKLPADFVKIIQDNPTISAPFRNTQFIVFKQISGGFQKAADLTKSAEMCKTLATEAGYTVEDGAMPVGSDILPDDLRVIIPGCDKAFGNNPFYVYKKIPAGESMAALYQKIKNPTEEDKKSDIKTKCQNYIQLYRNGLENFVSQENMMVIVPQVWNCVNRARAGEFNKGLFPRMKETNANINAIFNYTDTDPKKAPKNLNAYDKDTGKVKSGQGSLMKESKILDKKLKGLIRENLINVSKNKSKKLIQEQKIVKTRFNFLAENVDLNTRNGKRLFAKQLVIETVYLRQQGFNNQIINESFWETMKSFFGAGFSAIPEYFKEYLVKSLLEKFGVDTNGWIANIVITAIGNIDLADIPKLTDCNYLSKLLSKSLAEGALRKLEGQTVGVGPLQSILRNALVDVLDSTELGEKIESALGSFICPMLSSIAGKMDSADEQMKTSALGTGSNSESGLLSKLGFS